MPDTNEGPTDKAENKDAGSPEASMQPFRFLSLPYDIRRLVYERVPRKVIRPVYSDTFWIFYEDIEPNIALLQTCRLIRDEAADVTKTLLFAHRPAIYVYSQGLECGSLGNLFLALDVAICLDKHYHKIDLLKTQATSAEVRKNIMEVSLKHYLRAVGRPQFKYGQETSCTCGQRLWHLRPSEQEQKRFKQSIQLIVMHMRRKEDIDLKILVKEMEKKESQMTREWCDVSTLCHNVGMVIERSGRQNIRIKSIFSMVCASDEEIEFIKTYQAEHKTVDDFSGVQWEVGTPEEKAMIERASTMSRGPIKIED